MSPETAATSAALILALHVAVILFNVFGLIVIPLGASRAWRFVRIYWWRLLHLVSMTTVALQAIAGRACFLTVWQATLEESAGAGANAAPLIQRWVETVVYWPLPPWVFAFVYVIALIYVVVLWRLVPPERQRPA